ncbi:MAG: Lrp/AsnC family transcriptional regulator [Bdellovibrionota bacterium]
MKIQTNQILNSFQKNDLDRIDFEIMQSLQKNARLSNKELAAKVGLAPSSCLQRVRYLQKKKVIRSFYAEVDPAAFGIGLQALIAVRLKKHSRNLFKMLHGHLVKLPEVISIAHISGANDLLVRVAVRDTHHLRDLIVDRFATRPEVDRCETSIIYDYFQNPSLPNLV